MTKQNSAVPPIQNPEPEFAAFVAIDWADQKHFWSLQVPGSQQIERGEWDNTPEAIEVWGTELHLRFGGRPLAVALEQRRGALVAILSQYGQLHFYPVHPLTLAKYREAWYPSRSKDDPKDADLLREILCQHRDRWRRLDPDTAAMRLLPFQVENRRKLVDQRTALSNRLTDLLKLYYPQILLWFPDVTTLLGGDLLLRWPTLRELQKAKTATWEKFFHQHNCRDQQMIQQRWEQIRRAIPATRDEAVIGSARCLALVYVQQIACLRRAIGELDNEIAALARQQPDWEIFDSLPGAGEVLAPRLMAALGSRRERFASAAELQCFSGIAPVKEARGNSQRVHRRWACPKFLRQSFQEWAACSIPFCAWAKAYYDQQRSRKKSHHTAIRALAFKWMRILYRCWKDRQPYREEIYLLSWTKRNTPLLPRLAQSVQIL
jgi:Transposase/Transposase IS116/IS110/IS902 family